MATTWTEADAATLEDAIASGATSVTYVNTGNGTTRTVNYQSTSEMLKALAVMRRAIGGSEVVPYRLASTKKGFCP